MALRALPLELIRLHSEEPHVLEPEDSRKPDLNLESLAVVTHYLQSFDTAQQRHYTTLARKHGLLDLSRWLQESKVSWNVPFRPSLDASFTFIDLFAGIGGMRIAFERAGGRCVFSSEWDPAARSTYFTNFAEVPFGDITKIANEKRTPEEIPRHDVLVAGFPCQAFSIAGFKGGFNDTRGTLFFNLARVIEDHRPKAFLLENVKGLAGHDRGRTLNVIMETLTKDLGYHVTTKIVNAKDFGVPQNRERIFIVGFKNKQTAERFKFPESSGRKTTIADIKEHDTVDTRYYLSDRYLQTLIRHRDRHAARGNGFGFDVKSDDEIANAIVVGGMGKERNLLVDKRRREFTPTTNIKGPVNTQGIRKMTPREWARLQGFPDKFVIPVADAQAYKQFGNSVAVPAIAATARQIIRALEVG
jgi:DNA (cytosine-5)-methyltransferase 1